MGSAFKFVSFLLICFSSSCAPQEFARYYGNWEGTLPSDHVFNFEVVLQDLNSGMPTLVIASPTTTLRKDLKIGDGGSIQANFGEHLRFEGVINEDTTAVSGFLTSGVLMYHVQLKKRENELLKGEWNPLMVHELNSQKVYLSFENDPGSGFATYPFFGDRRFTGTWCGDFKKRAQDTIVFRDFKTGLQFKAELLRDTIRLKILLADSVLAAVPLSRSKEDWDFGTITGSVRQQATIPLKQRDGWNTATLQDMDVDPDPLVRMLDSIHANKLMNTHAVLIAKKDTLVYEAYFDGYDAHIPHDQRSASKSISSAVIGISIDDKIIEDVEQKLYDFIPEKYQYTRDSLKLSIRLQDLLTMSSGLDVNGKASEGAYQETRNWLKTVLEAPMVNPPGTRALYGSANPYLLGIYLKERLRSPLEHYMDQSLFAPLGITNYIVQTDNTGNTPYFGGGMYLTPRDMLKFGQLYLNGGDWKGKRIISEDWVRASFTKHTRLQDVRDKNGYGYQWWHNTYQVADQEIQAIEARGAGGQYIFVIPELASVVVITSGNFGNGNLLQQPEHILETYILPALLH